MIFGLSCMAVIATPFLSERRRENALAVAEQKWRPTGLEHVGANIDAFHQGRRRFLAGFFFFLFCPLRLLFSVYNSLNEQAIAVVKLLNDS